MRLAVQRVLTVSMMLTAVWWGSTASANLQSQIDQLIAAADLGTTKVAVRLVRLTDGRRSSRPLIELNDDEPMIPASNQKLLTTAAALQVLGPDFVFRTDLRLSQEPLSINENDPTRSASNPLEPASNTPGPLPGPATGAPAVEKTVILPETLSGALPGAGAGAGAGLPSLIIRGDGDPAFGDPELLAMHGLEFKDLMDHWVHAVAATGVKHFGQLIYDDRVFDRQFVHPDWPRNQLHRWYCAPVAGLNFHDNVLHVMPQPAHAANLTAVVDVYPKMPFLKMSNRIRTGKRDDFRLDRSFDRNEFSFFGTIRNRATQPHKVTFYDPPQLMGQLLRHRLKKAGIQVDRVIRPGAHDLLPESELLHRVQTSLPIVLNRTNQDSMNLFAEALIKRMGRAVTGAPGSWDNGSAAIRQFLTGALGPSASIAKVADGSGMSRNNTVTARLITDLLEHMYQQPDLRAAYLSSLARAGVDTQGQRTGIGTLDDRMRGLNPGAHVYAKTGYINSVNTLSGYLILARDDTSVPDVYAFSILFNGFAGKVSYTETKALQDRIIASWQENLQGEG